MVSISMRYSCSRRRSSGVMGLPSTVYRLTGFFVIVPIPPRPRAAPLLPAVLELEPVRRSAGAVARTQALGDDAFAAEPTRVREHGEPGVVRQVLVQPYAGPAFPQNAGERGFAALNWLAAQILAVEFEEIEGEEEGVRLVATAAQDVEPGQPALVAADDLAVDQAGADLEVVHGLDDERKAARPIVAAPRDQPDADRTAPGHEPETVVLDLVDPVRARRRAVGRRREARLDETQNSRHRVTNINDTLGYRV